MKRLITALVIGVAMAASAAAQEKKELTPQQKRMAECSAKAKGLKGEEFKKARDGCLKGEPVADKKELTPQQQKMADCNAKAKGLKGEEFRKSRDSCLKS
jgi:hypothetical protein